ncbi:MAG: sulfurtransferase TusA [Gammaproteobacteria bacterium]
MRERADHEIDTTGLICPEPLMVLRNKVRDVAPGETIYVVATDPSPVRDFSNYCRFLNHELVAHEEDPMAGTYRFLIRKGGR